MLASQIQRVVAAVKGAGAAPKVDVAVIGHMVQQGQGGAVRPGSQRVGEVGVEGVVHPGHGLRGTVALIVGELMGDFLRPGVGAAAAPDDVHFLTGDGRVGEGVLHLLRGIAAGADRPVVVVIVLGCGVVVGLVFYNGACLVVSQTGDEFLAQLQLVVVRQLEGLADHHAIYGVVVPYAPAVHAAGHTAQIQRAGAGDGELAAFR